MDPLLRRGVRQFPHYLTSGFSDPDVNGVYFRGEPDPALLETIPGDKISTVHITNADAHLRPGRTMLDDNSFFRVPPGEDGLPIVDLLKQLDRIGGLNRAGPEIFSAEFDLLSADEIGRRCRASLAKLFNQAGLPHRFK